MADFKPVQPGEQVVLGAVEWNAIVDAARAEQRRRHSITSGTSPHPEQLSIVKLKNVTGTNLPRGAIVDIQGGPVFTSGTSLEAFLADVTFRGTVPTSTTKHAFGVLSEPILAGEIGRATVGGIVACRVNITDATHVSAEAVEGDTTKLQSVKRPANPQNILWAEAGTGTRWALVRFDVGDCGCQQDVCTVVATIHASDCATPTIGQTGVAIEVFDPFDTSMGTGTTDLAGNVVITFEGEAGVLYSVRAIYSIPPFAERTTWEVFTGECGEVTVDVLLGQDDPSFGIGVSIYNNNRVGLPGAAGHTVNFPHFPAMGSQVTASDGTAYFPDLLGGANPVYLRIIPPPGELWIMGGFDGPTGQPVTLDGCHDFELFFQGPPG